MKAVGFMEFGGPDVLGVHDRPDPHPGAGEVRIRVRAATVNPTDISRRTGLLSIDGHRPPHIPGTEAAGVIDELGAGSSWHLGDQVMALAIPLSEHGGAYAEYLIAPDDSIARIPANSSPRCRPGWSTPSPSWDCLSARRFRLWAPGPTTTCRWSRSPATTTTSPAAPARPEHAPARRPSENRWLGGSTPVTI
jgi:hypothetical protein